MRFPRAMQLALAIADAPHMARTARRLPLPEDVGTLLEVAAGETATIAELSKSSGIPAARLQEAAGFFVEQILLSDSSDSYRILGGQPSATSSELRRHMALLMRWLHPDVSEHVKPTGSLDRGVLANRVARAWDDLKTSERRAAYDAAFEQRSATRSPLPNRQAPRQPRAGHDRGGPSAQGILQGQRSAGATSVRRSEMPRRLADLRNKLSTWLRRS